VHYPGRHLVLTKQTTIVLLAHNLPQRVLSVCDIRGWDEYTSIATMLFLGVSPSYRDHLYSLSEKIKKWM
jgi:hypothetical protein